MRRNVFRIQGGTMNNKSVAIIIAMLMGCIALSAYTVTVGEGNLLQRIPLDFFYKNSLNETLYYPDEIGFNGTITSISLYNNFSSDLPSKPVKIWMGTTSLPDLSGGWIPSTQLIPVFDGLVDFPIGENRILIPLQVPFQYAGQNLVVMFNRPFDSVYYSSSDKFYGQTGTIQRSINRTSDSILLDPANPTATAASNAFALTTFSTEGPDPDPNLATYPEIVDFGAVWLNSTNTRDISIRNSGGGILTVMSVSLDGSPFFSIQGLLDLPQNLSVGDRLSFQVSYNPIAYGEHNSTISLVDDTGRAVHSIPVSGRPHHLQLIYPNGDETWLSGTTQTIRWNSFPTNVDVYLSFDAGNNWLLLATVDGLLGHYNINVPALNSGQCKVKVVSSTVPADNYDESDSPFTISTNQTLPRLLLNYPSNSNIHLQSGESININWTRFNVTAVSLDLSTDDGVNWMEIANVIDADSFVWTLTDTPGLNCRIRVRSAFNHAVTDISDNAFSISKIQILSPLGGEVFTSDYSNTKSILIHWAAAGMTSVKHEYSPDGGISWIDLGSSNASSTFYIWRPPGVPSDNYLVRVSNSANPAINSVSGNFTLRNPIRITHPSVGGFVTNSNLYNIRWVNQDINPGTNVWWEYSLNNSSWTRIYTNANPAGSQTLGWYVTTGLDDSVWLRAVDSSNKIITKSEGPFTITDKSMVLWSPNGGEVYNALSTQTIQWEAFGCASLNIKLSIDDGVTWSVIATNIPSAQGTYQWLLPNTPSVNCLIRLQDTSYAYMNTTSDACFSILPLQILPPTVDFDADISVGEISLEVQFTENVNPGVGSVSSRLWNFGDGNTSNQENPLHTYTLAGTYTVSLSITNDFGGVTTETKPDYITALPNTPRIELLSAASLNYGVVYLGDTSPAQIVQVKNIGTAPLNITSFSLYGVSPQFALLESTLPIIVPVNETCELQVQFIPIYNGSVVDSLFINSNASNNPSLAVALRGIGEYVPPAAVGGVEVNIVGNNAVISWLPVTETIYGSPITPDFYIVLYNETPYTDSQYYYYLTYTPTLSATHLGVALFRDQMFYRVVAYKSYRDEEIAVFREMSVAPDKKRWSDVLYKLSEISVRAIVMEE